MKMDDDDAFAEKGNGLYVENWGPKEGQKVKGVIEDDWVPSDGLKKKKQSITIVKIREYVCKCLQESEQEISARKIDSYLKKPSDQRVNSLIALGMEMQISFLNYRETYPTQFKQRYQFMFI